MTTKTAYRAIYNRTKQLDQNGRASVIIEAYQNGIRRYFKTGIRLKPCEWDKKKNEVKGNPQYNRLIRARITELETFETSFPVLHNRTFTIKDFDLFEQPNKPIKEIQTLTGLMLALIERDRKKWQTSTYYHYLRTAKNLIAFNNDKPVAFDDFTYTFVEDHDFYLRTKKDYKQNTIYKAHQIIHKYLVKAERMGLTELQKNPYNDFEYSKEPTERVVLYSSEIARLEKLTFDSGQQHLAFYRDAFLFGYYTLLRISDVTSLQQSHIINTDKGLVMELIAQKTGKTNRLPLYELHRTPNGLSKPEQLVIRYARTDRKPLFDRSHPKMNEYIKEVFKLAKINKPATFHTARHSGITYLVQVLPVPYVQQLAQHSSIQTTMIYVHIAGQMVEDALAGVEWYKV